MLQEQKDIEVLCASLSNVDTESVLPTLLTECDSLSLRVDRAIGEWQSYVTNHAELDDGVTSFLGWIGNWSIKTTPPASLEACRHALSTMRVGHLDSQVSLWVVWIL